MEIRALDPIKDESLLIDAYRWIDTHPQWFKEMDDAFPTSQDEFMELSREVGQVDFGIFDDGLKGIITLADAGNGRLNAHIRSVKGTSPELLSWGAVSLKNHSFINAGATEIFMWVYARHRGLRRFCEAAGFLPDGITIIKGKIRGKSLEWVRHSVSRKQWEVQIG